MPEVRRMKDTDMMFVVNLERDTAHEPFNKKQIKEYRAKKNTAIIVCDDEAGYAIFNIFPRYLEIVRLAVNPLLRRQGYGTKLMNAIIGCESNKKRDRVEIAVHQNYTPSHFFLKKMGFTAVQNKKNPEIYDFTYPIVKEELVEA